MNVRSVLFLCTKSILFGALLLAAEHGLRAISWDLEQSGHEVASNLVAILDYFITIPGHYFAFQPVAINLAVFVFWTVVYFAFGLANPALKKWLQKPRIG